MRNTVTIIAAILFLASTFMQVSAQRNAGSIVLSANPGNIAADGKSICTISAQVRNQDGELVPDDTEIRFSASLGIIEEEGRTSSGVARVRLVSSEIEGISIVTATWLEGQAVAQINVEFGEERAVKGPEYIEVYSKDYLAYSMDYKVLEAIGDVNVRYRELRLESAYHVQVSLQRQKIIARGQGLDKPFKIIAGDETIYGNMLSYDMGGRALVLSAETGAVMAIDLTKSPPGIDKGEVFYLPEEFDFPVVADSSMIMKGSHATIFPNQKIQFKHASMYIDGKKVFTLPYYVLPLDGYQPEGGSYIGYSTSGLTLNIPFYYSLTPHSSGALLVRHGESTGWGWYGQQPGWSLATRYKYETEGSNGVIELDRLTNGDWGAHLALSQQIDSKTRSYLYMDYPAHRDLFSNITLSRSFNNFSAGLNLSNSWFSDGAKSFIGDLSLQTKAKQINSTPLRYTISGKLSYSHYKGASIPDLTDEEQEDGDQITTTDTSNDRMSQSIHTNFYTSAIPVAKNVNLTGSLNLGYLWGESSEGMSTIANARMNWKISPKSNLQLSYRYTDRPTAYTSTVGHHSMSANWYYRSGKLRTSLYAIQGLDYTATNIFGDVSYRFDPMWRMGLRATMNRFGDSTYDNLEIALGRMIGNREIMAVWSESEKKIMFELGYGAF